MSGNATDKFIDGLFDLSRESYSQPDILQAKKCLLDYIGVTLAGARILTEKGDKLLSIADDEGRATVIGFKSKATVQNAILINGLSAHIAELDDGHRLGMIHLGAPIISALFSVAECKITTGYQLLFGIITGYEAAIRLSSAVQPSHKKRGYHTTSTCGTIGAAMGIAAALGYSREQIKATLSAAVTSAAGVLEIQEDSSELKPYNAARAAVNGYISAWIGAAGFRSPADILGGKRGFLSVMADEYDPSYLVKSDEKGFWIESIYMKKYASCRHSHAVIDAAANIMKNNSVDADKIEAVNVYTYQSAIFGHDNKIIESISSAKMSTPYSVAVAIITGKASLHEYTMENISDVRIKSLIEKVNVFMDPDLTREERRKRAAIVEIVTCGRTYREQVDYPKGEPENPLTEAEVKEKFIDLSVFGGKTRDEAQQIINHVWDIENKLAALLGAL